MSHHTSHPSRSPHHPVKPQRPVPPVPSAPPLHSRAKGGGRFGSWVPWRCGFPWRAAVSPRAVASLSGLSSPALVFSPGPRPGLCLLRSPPAAGPGLLGAASPSVARVSRSGGLSRALGLPARRPGRRLFRGLVASSSPWPSLPTTTPFTQELFKINLPHTADLVSYHFTRKFSARPPDVRIRLVSARYSRTDRHTCSQQAAIRGKPPPRRTRQQFSVVASCS